MYAKSMIEYVQARAVRGAWLQHLKYVPVALALVVATLPFTLTRDFSGPTLSSAPHAEPNAAENNPFEGLVQASVVTASKRAGLPLDKQQHAVVGYITRKFGVSTDVVQELVKTAYVAGKQYGVDPLLVVAIMAVESSFNPIAESFAGAKGLMQIIPKYHPEKFTAYGGEQSAFDPRVNILVGARIVREYLLMASGDLFTALQTYAGAPTDRNSAYTHRVLNEKDQLDQLAGFPKTERRSRLVMQIEPEQAGKGVVPTPVPLTLQPEPQLVGPTAPQQSLVPAVRPVEEAAHTPPVQPVPQSAPPAASVNIITRLQQPETAQRF